MIPDLETILSHAVPVLDEDRTAEEWGDAALVQDRGQTDELVVVQGAGAEREFQKFLGDADSESPTGPESPIQRAAVLRVARAELKKRYPSE